MNGNPDSEKNLWRDTLDCWRRLPNKFFFLGLLLAWLVLFQFWGNSILGYVHTPSLFSWLKNQYDRPDGGDAHGNLIPFLVVGLFWWKRNELLSLPLKIWWPGILILIVALAMHILGFLVQQPYLSIVALFTGIFGLMGMTWGFNWLRRSLFPFALFIFSIPLGQHGQVITFPLQQLVSWLAEKCAHIFGVEVIRNGTQLVDSSGSYGYDVAAACSGIHSLVTVFLLATVVAFIFLRTPLNRIVLLMLSVPFAVLGNLLRLLFIIFAAEIGGQHWGDVVHENLVTGLVPYIPAIGGFLFVAFRLEKQELKKVRA